MSIVVDALAGIVGELARINSHDSRFLQSLAVYFPEAITRAVVMLIYSNL